MMISREDAARLLPAIEAAARANLEGLGRPSLASFPSTANAEDGAAWLRLAAELRERAAA